MPLSANSGVCAAGTGCDPGTDCTDCGDCPTMFVDSAWTTIWQVTAAPSPATPIVTLKLDPDPDPIL
eukprot:7224381-Prymnesium_polylepis.1